MEAEQKYHGKTIEYWKKNAEEDYIKAPISVLKYITILEEALEVAPKELYVEKNCSCCATGTMAFPNCERCKGTGVIQEQEEKEPLVWAKDFSLSEVAPKEEKEETCKCCKGSGLVEGEHYDDLESCLTCNGKGTL